MNFYDYSDLESKGKIENAIFNKCQVEIKKLNDLTNIKTYTMEELDELLKSEELDESASEFSKFSEFSELKEQTETDLDIQYKTYKSKLNKIEEILNKLINENLKTELLLKIVKYINKDSLVNIIDDKVSIIKYINEIITEVDKKSKLPAMDDKEKQKYKDVLILLENLITFINNIKPKLIPIEPLTPQISRQLQPGLQRKAQPHKTQIEQEQIEKEKETSNMVSI
jgi:hypothetical protein